MDGGYENTCLGLAVSVVGLEGLDGHFKGRISLGISLCLLLVLTSLNALATTRAECDGLFWFLLDRMRCCAL